MNKLVITGATGFLGRNILPILKKLDYKISTLGNPTTDIVCDISIEIPKFPHGFDLVVHAAGKAHSVPKNKSEEKVFFDVNLNGTHNLLKGLENSNMLPKAFVFISSVAVYGCESGTMINENHPLNAKDSYGLSKIQAEQLVQDWCKKNDVLCAILRLPLLVGEDPPGNLGAMIKGIKKGYYFNIAGGKAKKSMVMAKDVAAIVPIAAKIGGIYNLTDGYHPTFAELSTVIALQLDKTIPLNLPSFLAKVMARVGDLLGNKSPINTNKLSKITADLTFDDRKAKNELNWKPKPVLSGWK